MLLNGSKSTYLCARCRGLAVLNVRHISRNTAIHRGLRSEQRLAAASPGRRRGTPSSSVSDSSEPARERKLRARPWEHRFQEEENDEWAASPSGGFSSSDIRAATSNVQSKAAPFRLPFTTAASEFLYGRFPVIAALRANRRKLYKLYIHPRANDEFGSATEIEQLAQKTDVNVVHVGDQWLPVMDRVSKDRPHNGLIIEVSPLPKPPLSSLGRVSPQTHTTTLHPVPQAPEDLAINGAPTSLPPTSPARNPIVLYVDSITDPGNLGAVIRSAYYVGVDALAINVRLCAPLGPAAVKASAGAAEAMPMFAVPGATEFLDQSARNGWKVVAAVTPEKAGERDGPPGIVVRRRAVGWGGVPRVDDVGAADVVRFPLIVAVGGEGEGLRERIKKRAEYVAGVNPARDVDEIGVDSLNVSVATALICQHFIQASAAGVGREGSNEEKRDLW